MIALTPKHIATILLPLAIASIASCMASGQKTIAEPQTTTNRGELAATNAPRFAQPIDCTLGEDCFILLYPDRDPSPQAVDFGCGRQTYDGHKGTDFAISDERVMAEGVAVTASAPGKVLRVRDGVADRRLTDLSQKQEVEGTECGNGIVIDHGNGWETQYCHLRNGSVVVRPGMDVDTGTVLGMVGASGAASFPHVHLSVRYQGQVVDPFVGPTAETGCNVSRTSLWDRPLNYVPTGAIRAGFASEPPKMDDLWEGRFSDTELAEDIPAILFWVHTYGVLEGDEMYFKLTAPNGQVIAENTQKIDDSSKTWMGYVGKRNTPERPIVPGVWKGEYRLIRGDKAIVDIDREIEVN